MKLNEQRDQLVEGIVNASIDLQYLRSAILRKMASPYGDGSKSNMVNAETDVLPQLGDLMETLCYALQAIGRNIETETAGRRQAGAVYIQ